MKISNRLIGPDQPPYIVAEIGANHGGDLVRALRTMEAAKAAGADAVKFQAYEAQTITINHPSLIIEDGPWAGQTLFELYRRCETPFYWFPRIAEFAREIGITWFASVFDHSSVDMLAELNVPAFKIASFELVDLPLIRYAAEKGKPMILSTGMADDEEVDEAVGAVRSRFNMQIAVLHCVSGYPTPESEANLPFMSDMRTLLGRTVQVGISDHTTGIEVPIAATALRARIIEKHFTLNRDRATADATFSLEPKEFELMVDAVRRTWAAMQCSQSASEVSSLSLRRSLYAVADIAAGEFFTPDNTRSIRPGAGLPPKEINMVIGRTAACVIPRGTPLTWDMVVK
jgi:N-acetylneuraminate synthase